MSWVAVGTTAVGVAGSYLAKKGQNKPSEEQRTTTSESRTEIPEWVQPYLGGGQTKQWPTPHISPEYYDWAAQAGEGRFAGQDPVNQLLSFDQLTDPAQGQMANLLGIGEQYSQVPPPLFGPPPAAPGQGAGDPDAQVDAAQLAQIQEQLRQLQGQRGRQNLWWSGGGATDRGGPYNAWTHSTPFGV